MLNFEAYFSGSKILRLISFAFVWFAIFTNFGLTAISSEAYPTPNRTYITFDSFFGFQIEFIGSNGKAHLWFPRNTISVQSDWATTDKLMCFKYSSNSYNPATERNGGNWECLPFDHMQERIVGVMRGDPYHLATGRVPYIRDKCNLPSSVRLTRSVDCH